MSRQCGPRGNHEYRSIDEVDDCPLYDVMAKFDLEDIYRENMAFMKISLGEKSIDRQYTYTVVLGHGVSKNKTEMFGYSVDGMDVFITGHTHQPASTFPAKIVIDPHNNKVSLVEYTHVTVPSFQMLGGYALKGMYLPQSYSKIPVIELGGENKKGVSVHWI